MPRVTDIFRHPLKSHGREALKEVTLSQGAAMPWDRHWAVVHEASKADGSGWASCANFSRGSKAPLLRPSLRGSMKRIKASPYHIRIARILLFNLMMSGSFQGFLLG